MSKSTIFLFLWYRMPEILAAMTASKLRKVVLGKYKENIFKWSSYILNWIQFIYNKYLLDIYYVPGHESAWWLWIVDDSKDSAECGEVTSLWLQLESTCNSFL